jgi:hypothetical protein
MFSSVSKPPAQRCLFYTCVRISLEGNRHQIFEQRADIPGCAGLAEEVGNLAAQKLQLVVAGSMIGGGVYMNGLQCWTDELTEQVNPCRSSAPAVRNLRLCGHLVQDAMRGVERTVRIWLRRRADQRHRSRCWRRWIPTRATRRHRRFLENQSASRPVLPVESLRCPSGSARAARRV